MKFFKKSNWIVTEKKIKKYKNKLQESEKKLIDAKLEYIDEYKNSFILIKLLGYIIYGLTYLIYLCNKGICNINIKVIMIYYLNF